MFAVTSLQILLQSLNRRTKLILHTFDIGQLLQQFAALSFKAVALLQQIFVLGVEDIELGTLLLVKFRKLLRRRRQRRSSGSIRLFDLVLSRSCSGKLNCLLVLAPGVADLVLSSILYQ